MLVRRVPHPDVWVNYFSDIACGQHREEAYAIRTSKSRNRLPTKKIWRTQVFQPFDLIPRARTAFNTLGESKRNNTKNNKKHNHKQKHTNDQRTPHVACVDLLRVVLVPHQPVVIRSRNENYSRWRRMVSIYSSAKIYHASHLT